MRKISLFSMDAKWSRRDVNSTILFVGIQKNMKKTKNFGEAVSMDETSTSVVRIGETIAVLVRDFPRINRGSQALRSVKA